MNTDKNRHAGYLLKYHLILVTKFRKPCITADVFQTLKQQMMRVAEQNGAVIEEINYERDHVHLLLSAPPQICLASLIGSLKSTSSRLAREKHRNHLAKYYWKPLFWSRGYLILSSGGAPISVIRKYIQEQGTDRHQQKTLRRKITTHNKRT